MKNNKEKVKQIINVSKDDIKKTKLFYSNSNKLTNGSNFLSRKDQYDKLLKYHETNDAVLKEELKKEIASCSIKYIYPVATKYAFNHECDFDELLSYGYIGLDFAIVHFDPNKSSNFYPYARSCIEGEIKRGIPELKELPSTFYYNFKNAEYELFEKDGYIYDGTLESIDKILDIMISNGSISLKLKEKYKLMLLNNTSLKNNVDQYEKLDSNIYSDIYDNSAETVSISSFLLKESNEIMSNFLNLLSERERTIIELFYGLNGNIKTISQIAEILDIDSQKVNRIRARAIRKMRIASSELLKDFGEDELFNTYETFDDGDDSLIGDIHINNKKR